jgi:hypothetical protein
MRHRTILLIMVLAVQTASAQNVFNTGKSSGVFRAGYIQAMVPFGISSNKPGSHFVNNDFTFYTDEEYGFGSEYQFFPGRSIGLQAGGFYYYAKESDRVDDGTVDASNFITLEGGGVYGGLTFRAGLKNVGFTSALNIGLFTFDYRMQLSYKTMFMSGYVTSYEAEAVSGPGTRIDAGMYAEFGRFGIYPSFQILYLAKEGPSALILKTLSVYAGFKF